MGVRDARGRFVKGSGKGGAAIKDIDHGYKDLIDRFAKAALRDNVLTVGIHEAEGSEEKETSDGEAEPATLAEIASFHEFGLGVPRRSFIADWADENRAAHEAQLRAVARAVVKGTVPSVEVGLARLGSLFVGQVQKRIADGIDPPLEESTVKAKGSSKPLISTGQLRTAIRPYLNGEPIE